MSQQELGIELAKAVIRSASEWDGKKKLLADVVTKMFPIACVMLGLTGEDEIRNYCDALHERWKEQQSSALKEGRK